MDPIDNVSAVPGRRQDRHAAVLDAGRLRLPVPPAEAADAATVRRAPDSSRALDRRPDPAEAVAERVASGIAGPFDPSGAPVLLAPAGVAEWWVPVHVRNAYLTQVGRGWYLPRPYPELAIGPGLPPPEPEPRNDPPRTAVHG